jgi:hypothetical protein
VLQAQRHQLRALLAGEVPDAAGVLLPPKPLGSALLLRRPWALLLRLVLQLGLPAEALMMLKGPARWGWAAGGLGAGEALGWASGSHLRCCTRPP